MPTTTPIPSVALRVKKNLRDAAKKCNALLAHQARQEARYDAEDAAVKVHTFVVHESRYDLEDAAGNLLEVKHSVGANRYPLRSLSARSVSKTRK